MKPTTIQARARRRTATGRALAACLLVWALAGCDGAAPATPEPKVPSVGVQELSCDDPDAAVAEGCAPEGCSEDYLYPVPDGGVTDDDFVYCDDLK